jgi:hypothetical protein
MSTQYVKRNYTIWLHWAMSPHACHELVILSVEGLLIMSKNRTPM